MAAPAADVTVAAARQGPGAPAIAAAPDAATRVYYTTYYKDGPHSMDGGTTEECAALFSSEYGVWTSREDLRDQLAAMKLKPGGRVQMRAKRLESTMLFDSTCGVVVARVGPQVVGQAFFASFVAADGQKRVRWITQLVVHSSFRRRGIAVSLIASAMAPDRRGLFAVGLVSSHPAAVRALECAASNRCSQRNNKLYAASVMEACTVPCIKDAQLSADACVANTSFFVDHTGVGQVLAQEIEQGRIDASRAWQLGELSEGHEFLAIAVLKVSPPA